MLPKPIAKAATPTPPPPIATGPKLRSAEAKPATPPPVVTRLAKTTIPDAKTLTVHTTTLAARATPVLRTTPVPRTTTDPRYPWKSNIVTTVFWVGEPVGGNNFTHNFSSSWDANWSQSYGGFDNPNPQARHRFIPVKFVPKQNPFYIALPYNDVTRGTTKPEARSVIPWFRQAFRREGQSVCRDRWVAVRNRAGRIGYAQWSDCGPFRTDHWQYVFGTERPKPNLNKGAGLDVSPALRDYLGLQGTDMTDWKFVEFKDVPNGPWSLYGANNPFANKTALSNTQVVRSSGAGSSDALVRNP